MKKFKRKRKNISHLFHRWILQIANPFHAVKVIRNYFWYLRDLKQYSKMEGAERINFIDTLPCLHNKTSTTRFDKHYFYQDIWALKRIRESKPDYHVDVGSKIYFVGFLTVFTKVTFIDIRPLITNLENFESKKGSILSLPYENNSVRSLSCLHVAEHIGLGRYGDPLDPKGTKKAARELSRVLALGGNLFFSVPIGKPRVCFNAHRIHSTQQIFGYFSDLKLVELSGVDDEGNFVRNIKRTILDSCSYGCGFFWFTK